MRDVHESCCPRCVMWCLLIPLGLAFAGCGGRDVTGPVPVAKLSTDKVSYERKPGPGLQRYDLGELVVTEKLEPAVLLIPPILDQNTEIIVKGTLRWPKAAGKVTFLRLEFFHFNGTLGREVTLQEAAAFVKEKNGLIHFESDLTTAPREFVGKCKVRLWADTIPIDYDPSSKISPKETSVVVGLAETEMR